MPRTEHVRAADAKGQWVTITIGSEEPANVKITTVRESGRSFVNLGFKHPTCGTVHQEFPKGHPLPLAAAPGRRR
jgi:hypothetical protein